MAKMTPPLVPEKPVPVFTDDQIWALLASCKGRDVRDRRDLHTGLTGLALADRLGHAALGPGLAPGPAGRAPSGPGTCMTGSH
jgi:hypothetical protein